MLWTRLAGAVSTKARPTFVGVSQTDSGGNASSLSINVPSGVQNGDLLIATVFSNNSVTDWIQSSFTWALESATSAPGFGIAYRIASSEPSSYSFTVASNRRLGGQIIAFRGAEWDTIGTLATATYTANSINVSQPNSVLIGAWAVDATSQVWTAPSGMDLVSNYAGGNSPQFATYRQSIESGATGTRTASTPSTNSRACVLFSIKPS